MSRITRYKIVETQTVTDEDLEQIINEWVEQGWLFDGIQFAMRESSKRPAMAFIVFTRRANAPDGDDTDEDNDTSVFEVRAGLGGLGHGVLGWIHDTRQRKWRALYAGKLCQRLLFEQHDLRTWAITERLQ